MERYRGEFRKNVTDIAPEALKRLEAHGWPGNVRELRNAVERAVLLADATVLRVEDFAGLGAGESAETHQLPAAGLRFDELERDLVGQALERTGWNTAAAAALLGVDRDWVRYRIERHRLRAPRREESRSPGIVPRKDVKPVFSRGKYAGPPLAIPPARRE